MTVENKKTTWIGYLTMAISLATVVADIWGNGAPTQVSAIGAAGAAGGAGLIAAKDGRH